MSARGVLSLSLLAVAVWIGNPTFQTSAEQHSCETQLEGLKEQLQHVETSLEEHQQKNSNIETTAGILSKNVHNLEAKLEERQKDLEQQQAKCREQVESAYSTEESVRTMKAERDGMQASRLEVASQLESAKAAVVEKNELVRGLESKVEMLTTKTDDLVKCKSSKAGLKKDMEHSKSQFLKDSEDIVKKCNEMVASSDFKISELNELVADLNDEMSLHDEYLFSTSKLYSSVADFYTFVKCSGLFVGEIVYDTLNRHAPTEWKARIGALWNDKVVAYWSITVRPKVANSIRSMKNSELVKKSVIVYQNSLHAHVMKAYRQAMDSVAFYTTMAHEYTRKELDRINDVVSDVVVVSLVDRFPEMENLLPFDVADRIVCVAYVGIVGMFTFRLATWLLSCCFAIVFYFLGAICPCSMVSSRRHGHKKHPKRHPHKKPFQTVGATTSGQKTSPTKAKEGAPLDKENHGARKAKGKN